MIPTPCAAIWKRPPWTRWRWTPKYEVLREAVKGYRGILKTVETLLFELNHPFKNWEIILPEMRSFALKNFSSYARHPRGPEAMTVILEVFLDGLMEANRPSLEAKALDYLLGFLEKIIQEINDGNREGLLPVLERIFRRLTALPDRFFFLLSSSHVPVKRIAQALLRKSPADGFVNALNPLLIRSLRTIYEYWLNEEDPLAWLARIADGSPRHPGKGGRDPSRHFPSLSPGIPAGSGRSVHPRRIRGNPAEAPRPSRATSRSSAPIRKFRTISPEPKAIPARARKRAF